MADGSNAFSRDRRTHFPTLLRQISDKPPRLPLVATVAGQRLRLLIEEDRLAPEMHAPGSEPVVMLYYGKSVLQAYSGQIDPSHNYFAPVVLVLDASLLDEAAHVYPFDTGSWLQGGMAPEGWRSWPVDEFDLRDVREGPSRLVQAFYGSNYNYLANTPVIDRALTRKKLATLDTYAAWLAKLDPMDDPLPSAIEVQVNKPISLSTYLRGIVVPTLYLSDRIIADFLISFNVRIFSYSFFGGRAARYGALIDQLVMEHMKSLGVIHHG